MILPIGPLSTAIGVVICFAPDATMYMILLWLVLVLAFLRQVSQDVSPHGR